MDKINKTTGLTPIQEKAVTLLAAGKTVTETAKQLKIERATLYSWSSKANFQSYFNLLVKEIQYSTKNSLFGLLDEAHRTLRECLSSENESVRLKASLSILDRVKDVQIGQTNPVKMLEEQCTTYNDFNIEFNSSFDEKRFKKLMQENCLRE